MPSLAEVQNALAQSVAYRDDSEAASYVLGERLDPVERLAVYRNTFLVTLTRALMLSYPAVRRIVGDEFFEGAAAIFVHEEPPKSAGLDEYGSEFPDFLQRLPQAAALPYLPGVAQLEWAVNRALHAADAAPLGLGNVASRAPAADDRIRFVPHPTLGLVSAGYPVDEIWRAVLAEDDEALATIDLDAGPVNAIVLRAETNVEVARLDATAWRFLAALAAGEPLDEAIMAHSEIDAPAVLADLLLRGVFTQLLEDVDR